MSDRAQAADAAFAANPQGPNTQIEVAADAPLAPPPSDVSSAAPPLPASAPPPLPVGSPVHGLPPISVAPQTELDVSAIAVAGEDESDWHNWTEYLPSWLASMVTHLSLVLLLALVTTLSTVRDTLPSLVVSTDKGLDEGTPEELSATLMETDLEDDRALDPAPLAELPATAMATGPIVPIFPSGEPTLIGGPGDNADTLLANVGGQSLQLRLNGQLRAAMLQSGGGTPESEEAVRRALEWLAEHQNQDGSWWFQHHKHPKCGASCGNPGSTPGKIAATGLALLPFLGTGQTHLAGDHKRTIDSGLKFLVRTIKRQGKKGSLWDEHGTMYGHGLASIALCEAYGMTQDSSLREPAQSVLNFIVEAQHTGGGWRYYPESPGDTSVVGWQLMALKSGEMSQLRVPQETLRRAGYFLDSVQGERGAIYGYQRPDRRRPATSAIGLLCRMYLGWDRSSRPLDRGVRILSTLGPSTNRSGMKNNMYYNFYATQVLHHWGGYPWERWNAVMRNYLVKTQSRRGHEKGSWYFDGSDLGRGAGGRLYFTAMAAMTLEVYYRHMPLYRDQLASE